MIYKRATVPVIIGNRCILMIGAFIDPFLNRFAFSKCQSLPIPQNQRIFPSNSRKPKSLPVIIGNHCILMIRAFIDPFLNRFAFSKCRSLPIPPNQRIFPSNSRKPKSLPEIICGWVSTIFLFCRNAWNPPKFNAEYFRWCKKVWGLSGNAPSFFPRFLREMN